MPEQALQYRLAEPKPEDFTPIPGLGTISKYKAKSADGGILTEINWYDTKLLVQGSGSDYFLPTSSQWSKAREYLQKNHPELEKDFITGAYEWVDSLLAFPDSNGKYSPRLRIPDIDKGKDPLLIEQSKVEKDGDSYVLTEGRVTEVPWLPLKSGYIQGWNEDFGLPSKVGETPNKRFEGAYFWVYTNYDYHEGLRALIRGHWCWHDREGRFRTNADWDPSSSDSGVGFRRGRVENVEDL